MTTSAAPVLVVVGASGGLGASTFAAALGRRAAVAWGDAVLVDLDLEAGGLDVTVGVEHLAGVRWGDLGRVRGRVEGRRLVEALPVAFGCALLSAGRDGSSEPPPPADGPAVRDVLASLAAVGRPVVVDLPARSALVPDCMAGADAVVLLAGLHARGVSDLHALRCRLPDHTAAPGPDADAARRPPARGAVSPPLLVTTGGRVPAHAHEALARHLALVPVGHLPTDPRVARSAEAGEWPGGAGPLRHVADAVLAAVRQQGEAA